MALDFNGTTSKSQHDTADLNFSQITVMAWIYLDTFGESNLARILVLDEAMNSFRIFVTTTNPTNGLRFIHGFSTTNGDWHAGANSLTTGVWHCVAMTYDRGSTSNDPVFYIRRLGTDVNMVLKTTGENTAPVGTAVAPNTGYTVGNISDQTRTFDGAIAHVQVWNRILTAGEIEQAMRRPGSVTNGLKLWWDDDVDRSGNANNPTQTSVSKRDGPPVTPLFAGLGGWLGAFAGVTTVSGAGAIASSEAFGTPAIIVGPITITPTGIVSEENFGSATVAPGPVTVAPTGIASDEAFGSPVLSAGPVTVAPTGIASDEAFGSPTVAPGPVTVSPTGIPSDEAFGDPIVTAGGQVISPTGVSSDEAFGSPTVAPGPVTVTPTGIPSDEAFGSPSIIYIVQLTGIPSDEAFGAPALSVGPVTVTPTGIPSNEAFGTLSIAFTVQPTGIPSDEAFGSPLLVVGPVAVLPVGIASAEAFGSPLVSIGLAIIRPVGIESGETFGVALILNTNIDLGDPAGFASYYLRVRDHSGLIVTYITQWQMLKYTKRRNQPGEFVLRIDADSEKVAAFAAVDYRVEVWRRIPGSDAYCDAEFFYRVPNEFADRDGLQHFVASGPGYLSLLKRRLMIPATGQDKTVLSGVAGDTAIYTLAYANAGAGAEVARRISSLQIDIPAGIASLVSREFSRNEKLLGAMQGIAKSAKEGGVGVDFDVLGPGRDLLLGPNDYRLRIKAPYIGQDRTGGNTAGLAPIIFSLGRGNMASPSYKVDRTDEATVIFVGGAGEGKSRKVTEVTGSGIGDSPWNRIEEYVDASDQPDSALNTLGQAYLRDHKALPEFTFEVLETADIRYGREWDVGTRVTGSYNDHRDDVMVESVTVTVSKDGENIAVELLDV